jgi:mannose-6-phosphate isomerase-like protein (cupin superfamily)
MHALMRIVREGGESNPHYHINSDPTRIVLKGRVKFCDVAAVSIGEFEPGERVLMPGEARYWFEQTGEEVLELLQMVGVDTSGRKLERITSTGTRVDERWPARDDV